MPAPAQTIGANLNRIRDAAVQDAEAREALLVELVGDDPIGEEPADRLDQLAQFVVERDDPAAWGGYVAELEAQGEAPLLARYVVVLTNHWLERALVRAGGPEAVLARLEARAEGDDAVVARAVARIDQQPPAVVGDPTPPWVLAKLAGSDSMSTVPGVDMGETGNYLRTPLDMGGTGQGMAPPQVGTGPMMAGGGPL